MCSLCYFLDLCKKIAILYARVPERPKGEDLRSSGIGLRGFESLPLHYLYFLRFFHSRLCLSGSGGRALPW